MEKKELGIGSYETTSTLRSSWKINPVIIEKMSLTDQAKAAVLEYLTESDEFHKLVCDITGTERKQVKVSPELEKLKEDYSHVCNRYKQEQERSSYLLHVWNKETKKRMKAQADLGDSHSHHNNVMNRIKDLLKEVDMPSVKSVIEALKAERANGKLMAEQCELLKKENEKMQKDFSEIGGKFDRLAKSYNNVCKEAKNIEKNRDNLSDNYDRLAKDYEYLNKCVQNQANTITVYTEENKRLTDKVEKLKGKLDRASKRYGELIKIIGVKAIKAV